MKQFIRCLEIDGKRVLGSRRFLFCILLIVGIFLVSSQYHDVVMHGQADVLWMCHAAVVQSGSIVFVMALIPSLVYCGSYADDVQTGAWKHFVIRSGAAPWLFSKYISGVLAGMLVFGIGFLGYAGIMRLNHPLMTVPSDGSVLGVLQQQGRPMAYLLISACNYMLSVGIFCAGSMTISVFVPNGLVACAVPSVLYLILQRLGNSLLPVGYQVNRFMESTVGNTLEQAIMGKVLLFVGVLVLLGLLFWQRGKKQFGQ